MLWGSRHSRCGASWTGNWVVGEHKQVTQAACRCFVDEGIVPLLRLYSGIKTKWTLFIPCALLSSSPYGWYPLYPSPTIQSVIFLFLFRFVKNKHCPFKCPAYLSLGRCCTWTSSSRHHNYTESSSLEQKMDKNIKLLWLCQNKLEKKIEYWLNVSYEKI